MIQDFIEVMRVERGASNDTLAAYLSDLTKFEEAISPLTIMSADATAIRSFIDSCVAPRTQARKLSVLRCFYRHLQIEHIRDDNPAEAVRPPRVDITPPKYLSVAQVDRLLAVAPEVSVKAHAGLEILYSTGMRVSELLSLRWSDMPADNADPLITFTGKGALTRTVVLSPRALAAVALLRASRAVKAHTGHLFPGRALNPATEPMSRQGFTILVKKAARFAGITLSEISPHVIRHSFATHMVANGIDLQSLQDMLGHADISTTQLYTHAVRDNLQSTVNGAHPLGQPITNP